MTLRYQSLALALLLAAVASTTTTYAFVVAPPTAARSPFSLVVTRASTENKNQDTAFVPDQSEDDDEDEDDDTLDKVELLGRGASKVRQGKASILML